MYNILFIFLFFEAGHIFYNNMSFKVEKQFKDKSVVFVSWFISDILLWLYILVDILIFQSLYQKITTQNTHKLLN